MTRRPTPDSQSAGPNGGSSPGGFYFDALAEDVRRRAAQLSAVKQLLAAAAPGHEGSFGQRSQRRSPYQSQQDDRAAQPRRLNVEPPPRESFAESGPPPPFDVPGDGDGAGLTAESWQRRQIELLERIDENLRRLRELQEAARPTPSAFTEPAY